MMNQEYKRPVTLEDLLRLKRAERPPAEFWAQFDRELRAKQLAAIVEKRPWWRALPSVFGGLSRYHLPLGATAILALTVLTVREYRSVTPQQSSPEAIESPATIAPAPAANLKADVATGGVAGSGESIAATTTGNDSSADAANLALVSDATVPGQLAQLVPLPGAAPHGVEREVTPTARFIAASLALAQSAEPAVAQSLLGAAHGFEARGVPARPPVADPLAHMTSPSDVRRRMANGAVMSVSMNTAAPARSTEFRSRRLSDDQLYDTISRIDARGNSVGLKF